LDNYQLKRLSFKLYLEGIEIPFRSVTISHNDTTTFNINIPPYHEAFDLKQNTNGLMVYKEKKTDEWKMLCEGVYIGNGYSKRPKDRTVTLKFKDVKWFMDNARIYDFMNASSVYGPRESVFYGDSRFENKEYEETEMASSGGLEVMSEFIESFGEGQPITDSITHVLETLMGGNAFLDEYVPKYKIGKERFNIIENDLTETVFSLEVIQNIYSEILNESSTMTRVIDLIYSVAQIIQYDIKPIPGMTKSDPLNSYVMKPNLQFTTPPACNVVFPDENTSFNYQKDETQIPTRYRLVDDIIGTKSAGYYSPAEILENFDAENGIGSTITDEEKFKGIIPYQTTLPLSQTLAIGFTEGSWEQQVKSKSSFTNYLYYKEKYKTVPLSVEVAFKPDILPGFPALILDKEIPLVGYLVAASHNINPSSGYATTTLTMSHVRPFNEKFPQLAGWYSIDQFGVNEIQNTYQEHMDVGGAFDKYETKISLDSENMVSMKENIEELQRDYYSTTDRITFQNNFKREIATFTEYRDALDITMRDGELYGGPYDISLKTTRTVDGNDITETVSIQRRNAVKALKGRMDETSPRKFAKEGNNAN